MVRLGLALHGIPPTLPAAGDPPSPLRPISTLRTTILQVRQYPAGETLGYNRRHRLDRPSRIAVLPIGYADGLDRRLGNSLGHVYIHSHPCPIVGSVCMDTILVDVTDLPVPPAEGDPAILFSPEHPVWGIAALLHTIPYEILTSINPRVRRTYFREQ
jgi:alanine racemase/UDP-N-acetylmuramoyl-tripeptide--D-alanyl-D-alanine ligase